jgi:hypothetical protein
MLALLLFTYWVYSDQKWHKSSSFFIYAMEHPTPKGDNLANEENKMHLLKNH